MADAIDRADDGIAALDHAVDAHERVLLAAIVMHQFGAHPRGDPAQILDCATTAPDIEDAARDAGLHGLVADFGAGADRRVGRSHPLLPAEVSELPGEVRHRALGGTRALSGGRQCTRTSIRLGAAPAARFTAFRFWSAGRTCRHSRGCRRRWCPGHFGESCQRRIPLDHDLPIALGLPQQLRFQIVEARLQIACAAGVLVRYTPEHVAQHVYVAKDARRQRAGT